MILHRKYSHIIKKSTRRRAFFDDSLPDAAADFVEVGDEIVGVVGGDIGEAVLHAADRCLAAVGVVAPGFDAARPAHGDKGEDILIGGQALGVDGDAHAVHTVEDTLVVAVHADGGLTLGLDVGVEVLDVEEGLRVEAGDDRALDEAEASEGFDGFIDDDGELILDFDVEVEVGGSLVNDELEGFVHGRHAGAGVTELDAGIEGFDLLEGLEGDRAGAVGGTVDHSVVHDDEDAVAGHLDVKLKDVDTELEGFGKGNEGVFGHICFAAAVAGYAQFFGILIPHSNVSFGFRPWRGGIAV